MKYMTTAEVVSLGINTEVTIMGYNGNTMTLQGFTVSDLLPGLVIAESEFGVLYFDADQELTIIS